MAPLAAQALDARSFVPAEPRCEAFVDFKTLRDSGVWDGITISYMASLLPMIDRQLGFRLAEVDRLRAFPEVGERAEGQSDSGVVIWEGSDRVIAPVGAPETTTEKVGGHEVVVVPTWWAESDPNLWVAPKPGLLVFGARHRVEPVLLGKGTPGVTPPELLSLVAGRGVLAYLVMEFGDTASQGFLQMLEVGSEVTAPDFAMLRMRMEAPKDPLDDPQIHLDGTLRWADADKGPKQFADWVRTSLDGLKKHPRFAAMKKLWNLVEVTVDGRDVTLHIGLGQPREAGGLFALAAPVLMLTTATATPVPMVQEVVVEEAVPVPAPDPAPAPAPAPTPQPQGGNGGQRPNGGG